MAALCLATATCRKSPAAPTSTAPLLTGASSLSIFGGDGVFSNGQFRQACPGSGPANVADVRASAVVTAEGDTSRVRPSSPADGDFDIRLMRAPQVSQFGVPVTGSIRGVMLNTGLPGLGTSAPADARATFSGANGADAQLDGVISGNSVVTDGTVTGKVVVGNSTGIAIECASGTVTWSLSRLLR